METETLLQSRPYTAVFEHAERRRQQTFLVEHAARVYKTGRLSHTYISEIQDSNRRNQNADRFNVSVILYYSTSNTHSHYVYDCHFVGNRNTLNHIEHFCSNTIPWVSLIWHTQVSQIMFIVVTIHTKSKFISDYLCNARY